MGYCANRFQKEQALLWGSNIDSPASGAIDNLLIISLGIKSEKGKFKPILPTGFPVAAS
jgi:hypothetical protein